ncbi:MAG: PDZ domain-containing protein [Nannocystaceae bacterium]|nr:PDZ domain-containing protein [Myxococcales bacterium]
MHSTHTKSTTASSLTRWRTARSIVLGAIVLAGSMATSAAVMYSLAESDCDRAATVRHIEEGYTYSGVGAVIQQRGDSVVVRHVIPGGPADGLLREGAVLVSVDGHQPQSLEAWAMALRGPENTDVEVEVATCRGHKTVTISRQLIHIRR